MDMLGIQAIRDLLGWVKAWNIPLVQNTLLSPSYIIGLASMINSWIYPKAILNNLQFSNHIQTYLERCNFLNIIGETNESPHTGNSSTLSEITPIWWEIDFGAISEMFAKYLLQKMQIQWTSERQTITTAIDQTLLQSFSEIASNIVVHSQADFSKQACMYMMQYYSSTKAVHIACVDNGIWIVESLKRSRHYQERLTGIDYLKLALTQGITWNPREGQGNGLYACSQIVECIWWTLEILSWETFYQQIWQNKNYTYNECAFPWTLINLEVNLNRILENEARRKAYLWTRYTESTELPIYESLRT